jgi:hypothetical protein
MQITQHMFYICSFLLILVLGVYLIINLTLRFFNLNKKCLVLGIWKLKFKDMIQGQGFDRFVKAIFIFIFFDKYPI